VPERAKRAAGKLSGAAKEGLSTKIHAIVDALGHPIGFHLPGDQASDLGGADVLLPQMQDDILHADISLKQAGKQAVILPKANFALRMEDDKELYKPCHLIKILFAKLKLFHAVATRSYKTVRSFFAGIHLVAVGFRPV
jgi:transposase